MIHVPTMHEVSGNITNKQDSDEPGKQYRLYEFSGMGHIDTRDSVRMKPNPCALPLSTFPVQAYMSVALDHLLAWVDKGTVPPRAERILLDRNEANDGSQMALDEHGNPRAGIRTTLRGRADGEVHDPAGRSLDDPGQRQCLHRPRGTAGGQPDVRPRAPRRSAIPPAKLKDLYKSKQAYVKAVEKRLTELEKAGWSLPLYRSMILDDASKVNF